MWLITSVLILMGFSQSTSGTFLTQPANVTIEVGVATVIDCKLSNDIMSNRNWYINGSFTVENNLPIGIYAVENGLYIAGDYIKYYNQTGFQCSYSLNTGPPNFFVTFYSTVGILTVIMYTASTSNEISSSLVTDSSNLKFMNLIISTTWQEYMYTTKSKLFTLDISPEHSMPMQTVTIINTTDD